VGRFVVGGVERGNQKEKRGGGGGEEPMTA